MMEKAIVDVVGWDRLVSAANAILAAGGNDESEIHVVDPRQGESVYEGPLLGVVTVGEVLSSAPLERVTSCGTAVATAP